MDCKAMLDIIVTTAKSDLRLAGLLSKTAEYAQVYQFAKKRQKGCDGLGEMTNLKDELKSVFDEMVGYCTLKGILHDRGGV